MTEPCVTTSPSRPPDAPRTSSRRLSLDRLCAEANASCNCGVSCVAKSIRAAETIKSNPGKSNRAIAADLGISRHTVDRVRDSGGSCEPRTGQDGKSYSIRQQYYPANQSDTPPVRSKLLDGMVPSPSRIRSFSPPAAHCERQEALPATSWHYRAKLGNRMNGKRR
jgi:hypothetical protein